MRRFTFIFVLATMVATSSCALERNLPSLFQRYFALKKGHDFNLDFRGGSATFKISIEFHEVTENVTLEMKEELTVLDTEPNEDIEMCDGTVTDERGVAGVTFGTIDRKTEVFRGQFILRGETYYVEDADIYLGNDTEYDSVMYRGSDVIKPEGSFEPSILPKAGDYIGDEDEDDSRSAHHRTAAMIDREQPNTCSIGFLVDNGAWNDFGADKNKVLNFVYQLVRSANEIYGGQIKRGGRPGVNFVIGSIGVATDSYCKHYSNDLNCYSDGFGTSNTAQDSERFLNLFSQQDLTKECLNYVVTNRSFGSVLGIAYVEGVCSSSSRRSYNCGLMVKRRDTPQHSSDLTFAHEVGHNFGSPHDPKDTCPGQFVMHPYSHEPPYTPENRRFSECSVRSINGVLGRMASGRKTNCLTRGRQRLVDFEGGASSGKSWTLGAAADAVLGVLFVAVGVIAAA